MWPLITVYVFVSFDWTLFVRAGGKMASSDTRSGNTRRDQVCMFSPLKSQTSSNFVPGLNSLLFPIDRVTARVGASFIKKYLRRKGIRHAVPFDFWRNVGGNYQKGASTRLLSFSLLRSSQGQCKTIDRNLVCLYVTWPVGLVGGRLSYQRGDYWYV